MATKTIIFTSFRDKMHAYTTVDREKVAGGTMEYTRKYERIFPGVYRLCPPANRSEYIADKDMPFCPICNTRMYVLEFKGYYDKLTTWKCACDELPPPTRFQYSEYGKLHAEELYKGQLG